MIDGHPTCESCGLAACDLPDGIDPEMFFDIDELGTHCPTCEIDFDDPEVYDFWSEHKKLDA